MKTVTVQYSYTVECERTWTVPDDFAARVEADGRLVNELARNGCYDVPDAPITESERYYDEPAFEIYASAPDVTSVTVCPVPCEHDA